MKNVTTFQSLILSLDSAHPQKCYHVAWKHLKHDIQYINTMCMRCADATVQVEASVLQNAVVLQPYVLVFVHFMKQSKTIRVFHSQRGQIRVMSGDIHPHVVLKHES